MGEDFKRKASVSEVVPRRAVCSHLRKCRIRTDATSVILNRGFRGGAAQLRATLVTHQQRRRCKACSFNQSLPSATLTVMSKVGALLHQLWLVAGSNLTDVRQLLDCIWGMTTESREVDGGEQPLSARILSAHVASGTKE